MEKNNFPKFRHEIRPRRETEKCRLEREALLTIIERSPIPITLDELVFRFHESHDKNCSRASIAGHIRTLENKWLIKCGFIQIDKWRIKFIYDKITPPHLIKEYKAILKSKLKKRVQEKYQERITELQNQIRELKRAGKLNKLNSRTSMARYLVEQEGFSSTSYLLDKVITNEFFNSL